MLNGNKRCLAQSRRGRREKIVIRCSVAAFWGNATIFVAGEKLQHTTQFGLMRTRLVDHVIMGTMSF